MALQISGFQRVNVKPVRRSESTPKDAQTIEPIRHLLIFIDGTWASANNETTIDNNISNIYKLAVSTNTNADTHDKSYEAQIGFYFSGIGSGNDKISEGIMARELAYDVEKAYTNICLNYIPDLGQGFGDKIYLFGFSRGAFIARIVATLIAKFGLLKQHHLTYFPEVWNLINSHNNEIEDFKQAHCHKHPNDSYDTKIAFLGLFDTVHGTHTGTKSQIIRKLISETESLPTNIEKCVHIIAADEDRDIFAPTLWKGVENDSQILEQIWMPGAHSDVGGGYSNKFLGDVSLLTMLDRIKKYTYLGINQDDLDNLVNRVKNIDQEEIIIHHEWKNSFANCKLINKIHPYLPIRKKRSVNKEDLEVGRHYMSPIVDLLHKKRIYFESKKKNIIYDKNFFSVRREIKITNLSNE